MEAGDFIEDTSDRFFAEEKVPGPWDAGSEALAGGEVGDEF